ncbi:ABC transporter substrate-binding protein [Comamonas serinivorans]|uniref:ABC transporter substrate-binding protein n=1 Tax=Comamonas serinivorans TaxID=1082851 RepID=A0A1Y0ETC6_9BURK|nr:tripartite tricarboxylate transporter substrate binding protein [Comamonas serinivorans]ARU06788.1 ABC transporter substrate-binding protein [Comamonas serinivorans]
MTTRRHLLHTGAALTLGSLAGLSAPLAHANTVIRLVVPYAPGGPLDVSSRLIAEQAQAHGLGTVIVENKPGAGGNIGSDYVAKAPADGTVIGLAAVATHAINPWLFSKMPFDAAKDFAPITQVARVPNVLIVNADWAKQHGIATLAQLIAYAKAHPDKLNYGSGGNGSAGHLAGEYFKQRAGITATHVPFNGANPATLALLAGQVDFNIDNLATAAPNIKSGKVIPLAVTTATPSEMLPGVPTLSATLKGFEIDTWWGLVAPAATPADVIARLNKAFVAALNSTHTKARFAAMLATPAPTTPQQFGALMERERARYAQLVKASGAKVD